MSWPETDRCAQEPAVAGCAKWWWACSGEVSESFTGGDYSASGVSFGATEEQARRRLARPSGTFDGPEGGYDLTFSTSQMNFCWRDCEREFSWCAAAAPIAPRVEGCLRTKGCKPDSGSTGCAEAVDACREKACGELSSLARQRRSAAENAYVDGWMQGCKDCDQGVGQKQEYAGCTFVSVNPCAGGVGLVCDGVAREVPIPLPPDAADAGRSAR